MVKHKAVRRRRISSSPKRRVKGRSTKTNTLKLVLSGAMYGVSRQYTSSLISPITNLLPMGNIADELVMIGVNHFVAKTRGVPQFVKNAAQVGIAIEGAMLGQALASGSAFVSGSTGGGFQ